MEDRNDQSPVEKDIEMTLINTNARSLCPKINSLVTCFEELEAHVAVVTETWLTDGVGLQDDVADLRGCLLYTSPSPRDS